MSECSISWCTKPAKSSVSGWCGMHVERNRRGADMDAAPQLRNVPLDQSYRVDPVSGCWNWVRGIDSYGYGVVGFRTTGSRRAHRWLYEKLVGPIPSGMPLDHLCRNRRCVNPEHLEPVTTAENSHRGMHPNYIAYREDRCTRGHEYTPENTYVSRRGSRVCRKCHAVREAAARVRRVKEAAGA